MIINQFMTDDTQTKASTADDSSDASIPADKTAVESTESTDSTPTEANQSVEAKTDEAPAPDAENSVEKKEEVKTEDNSEEITESKVEGSSTGEVVAGEGETVAEEEEQEDELEELPSSKYEEIQPGMTVRVHQKIKEVNPKGEEKERIQVYEGIVIARKHGKTDKASITVRKVSGGVGVEKIFPLDMPAIVKIEISKKIKKVRRAKLGFLRGFFKKLREERVDKVIGEEKQIETNVKRMETNEDEKEIIKDGNSKKENKGDSVEDEKKNNPSEGVSAEDKNPSTSSRQGLSPSGSKTGSNEEAGAGGK